MNSFIPDTPNTAIVAMLVACLLPFIFTWIAKMFGGFKMKDNSNPREFSANLSGLAARANAAQQNSFETLPMFLAGVILAMLFCVPQITVNSWALAYVLIRIAFGVVYLLNLATLRSLLWIASMVCIFILFYSAMQMDFADGKRCERAKSNIIKTQ